MARCILSCGLSVTEATKYVEAYLSDPEIMELLLAKAQAGVSARRAEISQKAVEDWSCALSDVMTASLGECQSPPAAKLLSESE